MQKGFHQRKSRGVALVTAALAVTALVAGAAPAEAVVCTSTSAGLIGRWPGDGTAVDVAHGRDGTLVGDTTYVAGEVGQAFSFDGSGDIVTVPDAPDWTFGGNDFTVDTWVKFAGLPAGNPAVIMAHDPGGGYNPKWILWWRPGFGLEYFVNDPTAIDVVNAASWTPTVGQWYHVAVSRAGSTFTLYVDGAVVATATKSFAIPESDGPLTLGSAEGGFYFNGSIDEPEIYQRALSTAEIKAIHDQGPAVRCAPTSSGITLQTPATAIPGSQVQLSGNLTVGGAPASGTSIEISRSVDGGVPAAVATVPTAVDGSYTYDDTPPVGTTTYRASYAGDADIAAESAWSTVVETRSASKLELAASKSTVNYGDSVTVTAHLNSGSPNRTVSIYATPTGGSKKLLKRGSVNSSGSLSVKTKPTKNTTYTATYAGDPSWKSDTAGPKEVKVAARWAGKATGGYATDQGVRLYHYTTSCTSKNSNGCPSATFTLAPNHRGHRVFYLARYCRGGRCGSNSGSFSLNRKSTVNIFFWYTNTSVIGTTFSIKFLFKGDKDHARAWSTYVRMRVTG
jgi:hypothetical protein